VSDYSIEVFCEHGADRKTITRAEYQADYDEWHLPRTPASQMLAGDSLRSDATTGEVRQPGRRDTAEHIRLRYTLACPTCGRSLAARSERMQAVLTSLKDSNKYRLTFAEFIDMF